MSALNDILKVKVAPAPIFIDPEEGRTPSSARSLLEANQNGLSELETHQTSLVVSAPFKLGDWDVEKPTVACNISIPYFEAVTLFGGTFATLLNYFKFLGIATTGKHLPQSLTFAVYVLTWITLFCVFQHGWELIARKCIFYKLLQRKLLIVYSNPIWWGDKVLVLLVVWVIFGTGIPYFYHVTNWSTPLFIALNGMHLVLAYKSLLDTKKHLIPLSYCLDNSVGEEKNQKQWVQELTMVSEPDFLRYCDYISQRAIVRSAEAKKAKIRKTEVPKRGLIWDEMAKELLAQPYFSKDNLNDASQNLESLRTPAIPPKSLLESMDAFIETKANRMHPANIMGQAFALIMTEAGSSLMMFFVFSALGFVGCMIVLYGYFQFIVLAT